jgi:hypothetical protein
METSKKTDEVMEFHHMSTKITQKEIEAFLNDSNNNYLNYQRESNSLTLNLLKRMILTHV